MPFDKRPAPPPVPAPTGPRIRSCFNCGGTDGHQLQDCPEPVDRERIRAAREAAQKQREEDLLNNAGQPGQGKGHKQRGGGAIITSKVPGGVLVKQGVEMKEWMRTPQDCLIEYCKSLDRPKPRFDKLPKDEKGHRFRLVLQDTKKPGTDKDLIFMPSRGFEDEVEAKHTLALLALKELNPALPLERKLPDPYRDFWLALTGQQTNGSGAGGGGSGKGTTTSSGTTEKGKKGSSSGGGGEGGGGGAASASASEGSSKALPPAPVSASPISPTSALTTTFPSTLLDQKQHVLPTWDDSLTTTNASDAVLSTSSFFPPSSTSTAPNVSSFSSSTNLSIQTNQTQNPSNKVSLQKQQQQQQQQQQNNDETKIVAKKFTPPGPISAAAMAGSLSSSPSTPTATQPRLQPKKAISLDIGLASKGSVAEKKRLEQERERKKAESKNRRAVKMRELLARNADSFVTMSSAARTFVEGILRDATEEGRGTKKMSINKVSLIENDLDDVTSVSRSTTSLTDDGNVFNDGSDPTLLIEREAEADADRADLEAYVKKLSLPLKAQTMIESRLEKLGFTRTQVIEAIREGTVSASLDAIAIAKTAGCSIYDLLQRKSSSSLSPDALEVESAALDWLCLNVPEDKLPPAFDPRGKALEIRNLTASSLTSNVSTSTDSTLKANLLSNSSTTTTSLLPTLAPAHEELPTNRPRAIQTVLHKSPLSSSEEDISCRYISSPLSNSIDNANNDVQSRLASCGFCPSDVEILLSKAHALLSYGGTPEEAHTSTALLYAIAGLIVSKEAVSLLEAVGSTSSLSLTSSCVTIPTDDPLGLSSQELETSLATFGSDFTVSRVPIPAEIVPLILGLDDADCDLTSSSLSAQWAFTTLDVKFGSPPLNLCIGYVTVVPEGPKGLSCTDNTVLTSISSCVKESARLKVYPNVLPHIWITGGTISPLLPAERLNLSLNLLNKAIEARSVEGDNGGHATSILYDLWSVAHAYSSPDSSHLLNAPPDVLLPAEEKIRKKERDAAQAAAAAAALRVATRRKEASANLSSQALNKTTGEGNSSNSFSRTTTSRSNHHHHGIPRISPSLEASMCREDRALLQSQMSKATQSDYIRSQKARSTLPVSGYKEAVLKLVRENQVVLLSGATGCGKTTQVPQFILEDAISAGRGGQTRILCTQPRRIAAIGVSQRVAQERCEPLGVVGGCVGFQIRGEKKAHSGTNLLFSTTGVLLRRLNQSGLGNLTHVIVDEVHERNVDTDFLLAVLRRLLPQRPDVKVVLMSATMDAAAFAKYFEANAVRGGGSGGGGGGGKGVPVIEVPGFVHPVEEVYLERVLEMTGYIPKLRDSRGRDRTGGRTPTTAPVIAKKSGTFDSEAYNEDEDDDEIRALSQSDASLPETDSPTGLDLRCWKTHGLDYGLVASLVHHVSSSSGPHGSDDGSVLVFMPGSVEIRKLHNEIERYGRTGHMQILHLHGSLTADEQQLVFKRPPPGKRKIVLATNVAETSITIDDVTVVIDTFRVKENTFDALNRMSKLQETWTSVAASKQRRGRAGRVRPGTCYRLIPRAMLDTLAKQTTPEIMRTPLESLCLQAKLLRMGKIVDFMSSLIDPPPQRSLQSALRNLVDIGALQLVRGEDVSDYELTPLGYHVALLPLDVGLAKALIFGAMLRCVDPVLTVVAALSDRSPFRPVIPSMMDEMTRSAMEAARAKFTWGQSDHLAVVKAFNGWKACGSYSSRKSFADEHFLSNETLRTIDDTRNELAGALADMGFLSRGEGGGGSRNNGKGGGSGGGRFGELSIESNFYSDQLNVIRAALVAGLYPKVVKVVAPERKYNETSAGAIAADHVAKELRFFTLQDDESRDMGSVAYSGSGGSKNGGDLLSSSTQVKRKTEGVIAEEDTNDDEDDDDDDDDDDDLNNRPEVSGSDGRVIVTSKRGLIQERVFLHPSSFCFSIGEFRCPFLVFHEKAATNKTYVRDASVTTPYAMVLFGGPLIVHHREGRVSVGERRWVTFRAEPRVGVLAKGLRQALARLLAAKISDPTIDISSHPVIEAIARLLIYNGQ